MAIGLFAAAAFVSNAIILGIGHVNLTIGYVGGATSIALAGCTTIYFLRMKRRILAHLSKNSEMVVDASGLRKRRIARSSRYLAKSAIFIFLTMFTSSASLPTYASYNYTSVCLWATSNCCAALIGVFQLLSFAEGEKLTRWMHSRILAKSMNASA